ncbi:hypothetical protein AB205_0198650 [Aquarana catesbeiana]|uniref:Uncharacterized protein n=1 Tax=Aquarana catesbeiana TaxID=8400 RepID=A0A2G9QCQ5_AQUCT|nr:hypothetical protein AB205_0198650 [Aquarana catesbeiana]
MHETNAALLALMSFISRLYLTFGDPETCLLVCISTTGSPPSPGQTAAKRPQSQSRTTSGHE